MNNIKPQHSPATPLRRKVRWQVKIPIGAWMCGMHTFRSRTEAKDFIQRWLKADTNTSICDLRPILLRNGEST